MIILDKHIFDRKMQKRGGNPRNNNNWKCVAKPGV